MKCFVDLDGVLVDFVRGVSNAHGRDYPYLDNPDMCYDYYVEKLWGMSTKEFWSPCSSRDFWFNLDWMPDGKDILSLVMSYFPIADICVLTSPPAHPEGVTGKVEWIQKHLPKLRRNFMVSPVKHFCAHPQAILLDDRPETIVDFNVHGGHGVLVPRPWNENFQQGTLDYIAVQLDRITRG